MIASVWVGATVYRLVAGTFGSPLLRHRDLRYLYASLLLGFLGASTAFPLRLLYAQAHGASPTEIGLMGAAFFLSPLVAQLPLGLLIDRWGRVAVLMSGMCVHALIALGFIFFYSPLDLILLRLAEGVAIAAIQPAVNAYIADAVPAENLAEAYGLMNATNSGGMLIGPLIGGIVGQLWGFGFAFSLCFLFEIAAVVLMWGRVHDAPVHTHGTSIAEEFTWRSLFSLPLLGAYAAFFAMQIIMGMLSSVWSIWVNDLGGSYTYIGTTFTVFALPQIFLGALAGRLTDRFGRLPMLLIGGLSVSIIYASYGFMTNLWLIAVVGVIEGVLVTLQTPAAQSLLAEAAPERARGRVQGIAGTAGALGGTLAAFFSLPLYHHAHLLPFVLSGAAMTASALLASTSAVILARRRPIRVPATTESAVAR